MIKTSKELATACKNVAQNYKTLYVMGCFGAPMTVANKERYIQHHSYNQKLARKNMINAASEDTFGFDCVNLIKGLLWGWSGDKSKIYGGASYNTNGVPDTNANGMIQLCKDVSTNFSKIAVGEILWLQDHVGVYIGDGLAVECTPSWKNCVQITAVHNIGRRSGYNGRVWTKHGKLPYVTYADVAAPELPLEEKSPAAVTVPVLKWGSNGATVKAMQLLLKGNGYSLGIYGADGDFGSLTENAVEMFQSNCGLPVTGEVDRQTWEMLLGLG